MNISDKKNNTITTVINWTVSALLALFLIILSEKILSDIAYVEDKPYWDEEQYVDQSYLIKLDRLKSESDVLEERVADLLHLQEGVQQYYQSQKESFENWLATRSATEQAATNPEVIKRVEANDKILDSIQIIKTQVDKARLSCDSMYKVINQFEQNNLSALNDGQDQYNTVEAQHELKIFLIRLLFALPMLVIGVWFFVKFRRHKYKSLFWGFIIYAIYIFFFGLLPYLPSFGGYVRALVGVVLTVLAGVYAIKYWNRYALRKREELAKNVEQRKRGMESLVAQKAYSMHLCPSCGKDFLPAMWEKQSSQSEFLALPAYCKYCGMEIYAPCQKCSKMIYSHSKFCCWCGYTKDADNEENK